MQLMLLNENNHWRILPVQLAGQDATGTTIRRVCLSKQI